MINGAPVIEETERNLQNIHLLCIFHLFSRYGEYNFRTHKMQTILEITFYRKFI